MGFTHLSHQKGERREQSHLSCWDFCPLHSLRTGLVPRQRYRCLHSPPAAAPAGTVPSQVTTLPVPGSSSASSLPFQGLFQVLPMYLHHFHSSCACTGCCRHLPGVHKESGCSLSQPISAKPSSQQYNKKQPPIFPPSLDKISFFMTLLFFIAVLHGSISPLPALASFCSGLNCFD